MTANKNILMPYKLSLVIPCYNEQDSLFDLHQKILAEIQTHAIYPYEILFINDGSTDNTLKKLVELQKEDSNIKIISFFRNYGKAAALAVGFEKCEGEFVVTMDADLQDDPNEISKLLEQAENHNLDLVSGWKKERHDPLEKTIPSRFFNFITSKVGGLRLHDFNCGLKLYRKKVVKAIRSNLYGEMHRYIPLLAHWQGFKVGEMVVKHYPRNHGESKYGFSRYFHGFFDLITLVFLNRYRTRPMHIFGTFGFIFFLVGLFINIYFLLVWALTRELHLRPVMLLGVVLIIIAVQFFSLGFISEMITQKNAKEIVYSYEEISGIE